MVNRRWFEVHKGNATPWEAEVLDVVNMLLHLLEATGKAVQPSEYGYFLAGADAWARGPNGQGNWKELVKMLKQWQEGLAAGRDDTSVPGEYFTAAFMEIEAEAERQKASDKHALN